MLSPVLFYSIAPITSTIRDIPTEVILDQEAGLKAVSAINLDHIQTVSKDKVGAHISKLSESKSKIQRLRRH